MNIWLSQLRWHTVETTAIDAAIDEHTSQALSSRIKDQLCYGDVFEYVITHVALELKLWFDTQP